MLAGCLCLEDQRQELNFGVGGPLICRLIGRRSLFGEAGRFSLVLRHHLLGDELCEEGTGVIPAAAIIDLCGPNLSFRWT